MDHPNNPGQQLVGAKYTDQIGGSGPVAAVYREGVWLRICTDPYEGSVMLHAETIPHLIKALKKLQKKA